MSTLAHLLLLFLCVSLHACTARPLRITKKDTAKYHFDKEIGKVKLLNICESCSSTSTLKEMIFGGTPGTELSTSFQTDPPSFLATKVFKGMIEIDETDTCLCRNRGGMAGQCWDLIGTMLKKQRLQTQVTLQRTLSRWITHNPTGNHPFTMCPDCYAR